MKPWGCPKCGCIESRVDETSRDSEGYVVRIRKCNSLKGCDGKWETEEVVMAPGSFWGRAEQRNEQRRRRLAGSKTCHKCGDPYPAGSFLRHVAHSSRHAATLKPHANGSTLPRAQWRRYQREWKQRRAA